MDYKQIIDKWRLKHAEYVGANPIGMLGVYGRKMDVSDDRSIRVVANTDDIDCDNEVVEPKGADPAYYFARNKQVFADHRYLLDDAVGVVRSITPRPNNRDTKAWEVHIHVYAKQGATIGDDILTMAREGGVGCSIGFVRLAGGRPTADEAVKYTKNGKAPDMVTRKWGWIELSFTAKPCNVACQSYQAKAMDVRAGVIDNLLCKGRIRPESAAALGFALRERRKVVCRTLVA